MSKLTVKNNNAAPYISPDGIMPGAVYLYKEYDYWKRCSIVRMTEAEYEANGKHQDKKYEASHWVVYEDGRKVRLIDTYFDDPERLVFSPEDDMAENLRRANDFLDGKDREFLNECSMAQPLEDPGTALMVSGGSERVLASLERAKSMQAMIASRKAALDVVLQERMSALSAMKSAMNSMLSTMRKQVKQVMRVVTMIELYLGIDEDLVQISDGERAPSDTPLTLRQLQLYMDEELGDDSDGGLGWERIEDFDKWLIEAGGLDVVAPEKKCLVALRPRRYNKEYTDDAFSNWLRNMPNKATYFLIRNGDCVWRITTENLGVQNTLFPLRSQMAELQKTLENASSWDKERADDIMYDFRRRVFFMQGLVDRTDVFAPIDGDAINFMNLDGETRVNFVYDAEPALTDGRPLWKEFQKLSNSTIQRGSRIVLAPRKVTAKHVDIRERLYTYYASDYNLPNLPDGGLYEVDSKKDHTRYSKSEKYESLFIRYNPKDTIYSRGWTYTQPHERKNRISFEVFDTDRFIINFDAITVEDIDYYINSRADRPNYLELMPTLREVRKAKVAENESERHFINMLVAEGFSEPDVVAAVQWWKMKTIFKRPIAKDDAKAYRMIKKHLSE